MVSGSPHLQHLPEPQHRPQQPLLKAHHQPQQPLLKAHHQPQQPLLKTHHQPQQPLLKTHHQPQPLPKMHPLDSLPQPPVKRPVSYLSTNN